MLPRYLVVNVNIGIENVPIKYVSNIVNIKIYWINVKADSKNFEVLNYLEV